MSASKLFKRLVLSTNYGIQVFRRFKNIIIVVFRFNWITANIEFLMLNLQVYIIRFIYNAPRSSMKYEMNIYIIEHT